MCGRRRAHIDPPLVRAFLTGCSSVIRSSEHEWHSDPKTLAVPHQPTAAETTQACSTTRTEFMAETSPKTLKAILETIWERADYALKQLQDSEDDRAFRWKCKKCGYIKRFTRPASFETTGRCPRCKSTSFEVVAG